MHDRIKKQVLIFQIILVLLLAISGPGKIFPQGSWIELPSPINIPLKKCVFPDTLNGWAIGNAGAIIHTSNGGAAWDIQVNDSTHFMRDIFFLDKDNGWATAWFADFSPGTIFYRTTNSGQNWSTTLYPDSNFYIEEICFTSVTNGFFGTAFPTGKIYHTIDGGSNWLPSQHDSSAFAFYPIRGMRFLNSNTGFAMGGYFDVAGVIWRTIDGGISWMSQGVGPEPLNDILFKDNTNYITVGGDAEFGASVTLTSNSGVDWQYTTLEQHGIAYSIDKRTESEYWIALGFAGNFLYSSDAGVNWSIVPMPVNKFIYCVDFVNDRNGWGVGDHGAIIKFDLSSIGITSNGNIVPSDLQLHQNYPNPFNPVTKIIFDIPSRSEIVELVIYDALGRQIRKQVKNDLPAGRYEYAFDGTALQSGVYFYRLVVKEDRGEYSVSKKMLLIK